MRAEDGTFRARAVEWDLGYTSTNKEQVAVRFELLDVDEGARYLTWYGFFTDKTTERTLDSMRHCGWKGDDLFDLSGLGDNEVDLVLETEEDNEGKAHLRVRWVNSRGGLALKDRMDDDARRTFAQRMKGAVLAHKKKAPRPPAKSNGGSSSQQPPGDPGFGDDDIPF